jgi:integrase
MAAGAAWTDHELVICDSRGEMLRPSSLYKEFIRLQHEADGLEPLTVSGRQHTRPLTVHGLRHTAASMMLRAGVAPMVVSPILGHASLSITVDLYGHLVPEQLDDAAEAVERLSG